MGGQITINAKYIVGNASGSILDEAETIKNVAGTKFSQNGADGVINDKNQPRTPIKTETTQVKTIEMITPLEDGSKNDKSGGTQKGMVYGKKYSFKVTEYTDGEPKDKSKIKWMVKYHSPELSKNKWVEIPTTITGDHYTIFANEKDMCGRFAYIRAYINDAKTEGELKVWKHNRFRWFDREIVHEQIAERVKEPWRIKQGSSSLCGMATLYYAMLKRDKNAYEKLAKELFRTGEYAIDKYIIKPHEKALTMYEVKTTDSSYTAMGMFEIDWIVMATTRSRESLNDHFVYKGTESGNADMLKAVNWPDMLTRMCKEVARFGKAESHGLGYNAINNKKRLISGRVHDYFSNSDLEELQEIDRAYKWGRTILMMIDADMIEDKSGYGSVIDIGTKSHWVVYEGDLVFHDKDNKATTILDEVTSLSFKIFTWGRSPQTAKYKQRNGVETTDLDVSKFITPSVGIKVKSFKSNYYGYIEVY